MMRVSSGVPVYLAIDAGLNSIKKNPADGGVNVLLLDREEFMLRCRRFRTSATAVIHILCGANGSAYFPDGLIFRLVLLPGRYRVLRFSLDMTYWQLDIACESRENPCLWQGRITVPDKRVSG